MEETQGDRSLPGQAKDDGPGAWPSLPLEEWSDTLAALHLWLQIIGKVRLACSPWWNHSWHATFYVTARGLTTSPIPYGERSFELELDFHQHQLLVATSNGTESGFALGPGSVASFYRRVMAELAALGLPLRIHPRPNELEVAIRFDQDEEQRPYDSDAVHRFWRILAQADRVLKEFRTRFVGKCSPVHLFWGAADLAVTRFSGRTAPKHPGGIPNLPDWVTREAYSHEVSSAGFWAGGGAVAYPAFYSYAYPEPPGFSEASIKPEGAFYSRELGEFVLPYDVVSASHSPDATLLEFLQTTYEAAASLGGWDRKALESPGPPGTPRSDGATPGPFP